MNTVVKTQYGEVRGSVADGVHTFKGIPYASPPFGVNRLRPPQSVAPWSGVRDALTYGPKHPSRHILRKSACSSQSLPFPARTA